MKHIAKIFTTVVALLIIVGMSFGLSACFDDSSSERKMTITAETLKAGVGQRVEIRREVNFSPCYHKDLEFIFVANNCDAEFEFESGLEANYTSKFVVAHKEGSATIKFKHKDGDYVTESNELTIEFEYENEIKTVEDLKGLKNSNKSYVLANDIDLSGETNWEPISGFTGALEGNNHKISNMTINSNEGIALGLFGTLNGYVSNLEIADASITTRSDTGYAGILAGYCTKKASKITVSGTVDCKYLTDVGGIVGNVDDGTIFGCVNHASVTGNKFVGGLVGRMELSSDVTIFDSKNYGEVTGTDCVGGAFGFSYGMPAKGSSFSARYLYNYGTVNGATNVGGIYGQIGNGNDTKFSLLFAENYGEVIGKVTGEYAGGLIGYGYDSKLTTVSLCSNKGDVSGGNYVGGWVGKAIGATIDARDEVNTNTIKGKAYVGGFAGQVEKVTAAKNTGEIISTAGTTISNTNYACVGGIVGLCKSVMNCINEADITVNTNAIDVGGIAGCLDCYADNSAADNENYGDITSNSENVGGIIGKFFGASKSANAYSIKSNTNYGKITGKGSVGGIIGGCSNCANFTMLTNHGEVVGTTGTGVGGLIGYSFSEIKISISENLGNVTGGQYVGGWIGYCDYGTFSASEVTNECTITGQSYVGGFVGRTRGLIEDAINNGEIICTTGISLGNNGLGAYVGGVAGYCERIMRCINNADLTITNGGKYVGGLVGYLAASGKIDDNENHGNITAANSDFVGGVAGILYNPTYKADSTVTNNVNTGAVTGSSDVGGILGYVSRSDSAVTYVTYCENSGTITGSYKGDIVGYYVKNALNTDSSNAVTNTITENGKWVYGA